MILNSVDEHSVRKIAVIGAGSWGTVVANILAANVEEVVLWARDPDVVDSINLRNTNEKFLPQFRLGNNVRATAQYAEALNHAQLVLWAIPVQYTRDRLRDCTSHIQPAAIFVNLSKGIEIGTWYRPSQIVARECPSLRASGTLGGANIASEVAQGLPARATLAISNHWEVAGLEKLFCSSTFAVELSGDLVAVELAGALKNVVAIGAGICDGLAVGENAKATVIARGFSEIRMLGQALSANPEAFNLSFGLGDLLTTCYSPGSRNRSLGEQLGRGLCLPEAVVALKGRVAEGVATTKACCELARKLSLKLRLVESINDALENRAPARGILACLA